MSLDSELCFRKFARNLPDGKPGFLLLSDLETKGVENIVRFAPGGPGAGETTILEFAMFLHQIHFFSFCFTCLSKKKQEACFTLRQQFVMIFVRRKYFQICGGKA